MKKEIIFEFSGKRFAAVLDDTHCPQTVKELLGCSVAGSMTTTWGNEIYFPVGFHVENENATMTLDVGDVAYWPPGDVLCIFFGPTPASQDNRPTPASAVTVVGKMKSLEGLEKVTDGESVGIIL